MTNFKINFSLSPWLLLLLVPALAITLTLYFRLNKRYRKTRNRIISMILHMLVMTLCVCVLAGVVFTWTQPNTQSELVILVDSSYSAGSAKSRVDEFVKQVIDANDGKTKIAIVRFGYEQEVVLPMGRYSPEEALKIYEESASVDVDETATDISGALSFCWDPITDSSGGDTGNAVISHPNAARILLVSDGLQTDRDAMNVAKRIGRDGVKIEVSFLPGTGVSDVWFEGVEFPEKKYALGEWFEFEVTVNSTYEGEMSLTLTDICEDFDKEIVTEAQTYAITFGAQTLKFGYGFSTAGFHTLKFTLSCEGDLVEENNVIYTYYNLDDLNRILILEKYENESAEVKRILEAKAETQFLVTTIMQISDPGVPSNVVAMQEYDEIILVNISHGDMTKIPGFEDALEDFVYTYGGSVLTVGGFERNDKGDIVYTDRQTSAGVTESVPKPHAYDEDDMKNTKYQKMLPVEITKYTPPIGLVFIIDRSGSMEDDGSAGGPLDAAIKGAVATLDILSARDYVGVMTLESSSTLELSMTPMTKKAQIQRTIRSVGEGSGGGTAYAPAIRSANLMLASFSVVDIKHVVMISDGQPADPRDSYENAIRGLGKSNIAFTYFSINNNVPYGMDAVCKETGGNAYRITKESLSKDLPQKMYEEMKLDEYSGAVVEDYSPLIEDRVTAILGKITQSDLDTVTMHGFFSSKEKGSTKVVTVLEAVFVPLYSQWEYGNGKVGSFLCDAENIWSAEFLASQEYGVPIINGIIENLIPMEKIGTETLSVNFLEDNYRTQASVYGFDQSEEKEYKLIAFVESPPGENTVSTVEKYDLSLLSTGGNRFTFENRARGIHKVTIIKVPKSFDVFAAGIAGAGDVSERYIISLNVSYRVFSYSKEYDSYMDPYVEGKELLLGISTRTLEDGADPEDKFITDPEALLGEFMDVHYEVDPRPWLIIAAIILLLLDIAVRKFRFRWPHEIIAARRAKKSKVLAAN